MIIINAIGVFIYFIYWVIANIFKFIREVLVSLVLIPFIIYSKILGCIECE